jgi:broad specificity phosphatase PhoE
MPHPGWACRSHRRGSSWGSALARFDPLYARASVEGVRLLLIRHGQTPDNVRGVLGTVVPGPGLTPLGMRQAAAVPAAIRAELGSIEAIDGLFVSSMRRTHLTAAPLAQARGIQPIELPGLREIEAGDYEGLRDRDSVRGYLGTVLAWGADQPRLRMPGAFTGEDFMARFDEAIREIERRHPDGTVAVFSHGAAMRLWVRMRSRDLDPMFTVHADLDNTGMAIMAGGLRADGEPGFELVSWRGAAAGLDDETAPDVTGEPPAEAIAEAPER